MTTTATSPASPVARPPAAPAAAPVIAVVGAASAVAASLLMQLQTALPHCWLVAFSGRPLRWPMPRVSAYRLDLEVNRPSAVITADELPDVLQERAWDEATVSRRILPADVPDVLHMEAVDTLIHLGSHYDGPHPENFLNATAYWMRCAHSAGVRSAIYLSDYRVYGIHPGNPVPLTERTSPAPLPPHRILRDAEPDTDEYDALPVAVLRTAMVVGPGGSSPAAQEFFSGGVSPGAKKRGAPLQFLHEYDLGRAVAAAVSAPLRGVYNLAGGTTVTLAELSDYARPPAGTGRRRDARRDARQPIHPRTAAYRRAAGDPARHPTLMSATKFGQAAGFRCRYSSAQAALAYCHSVLLEPDDPDRYG